MKTAILVASLLLATPALAGSHDPHENQLNESYKGGGTTYRDYSKQNRNRSGVDLGFVADYFHAALYGLGLTERSANDAMNADRQSRQAADDRNAAEAGKGGLSARQ